MTKYGIIINEIKFGTISHLPQLYKTEEEAQERANKDMQELCTILNKNGILHYTIQQTKHELEHTTFYSNYIVNGNKVAFEYVILSFETTKGE